MKCKLWVLEERESMICIYEEDTELIPILNLSKEPEMAIGGYLYHFYPTESDSQTRTVQPNDQSRRLYLRSFVSNWFVSADGLPMVFAHKKQEYGNCEWDFWMEFVAPNGGVCQHEGRSWLHGALRAWPGDLVD